ncbi:MAG TPA: PorT family protein [Flavobacteriia bacterium]|nr:PorT family protein [Flavobacteriia bacterium]
MKNNVLILLLLLGISAFSQLKKEKEGYYLEDQIYFKLSYNALKNLPKSIHQSGFSNNFSIGYIRDIPINKERNFGFGIGLGYGNETYFHNMKITEVNNQTLFEYFNNDEIYKSNKLKINQLEIPFEIRWRTSTIEKFKFWRIYSGIKINYLFSSKSVFDLNGKQTYKDLKAINKLQYGYSIAAGYGTFNFYFYYGLTPLFKNAKLNDESLKLNELKFGLQFYLF